MTSVHSKADQAGACCSQYKKCTFFNSLEQMLQQLLVHLVAILYSRIKCILMCKLQQLLPAPPLLTLPIALTGSSCINTTRRGTEYDANFVFAKAMISAGAKPAGASGLITTAAATACPYSASAMPHTAAVEMWGCSRSSCDVRRVTRDAFRQLRATHTLDFKGRDFMAAAFNDVLFDHASLQKNTPMPSHAATTTI